MVIGNIFDKNLLNKVLKDTKYVYNFAAMSDLNQALNHPLKTAEINILGNLNVLEACRINNVNRFILQVRYMSTVEKVVFIDAVNNLLNIL